MVGTATKFYQFAVHLFANSHPFTFPVSFTMGHQLRAADKNIIFA